MWFFAAVEYNATLHQEKERPALSLGHDLGNSRILSYGIWVIVPINEN